MRGKLPEYSSCPSELIILAERLADIGGAVVRPAFRQIVTASAKPDSTLVTEVDLAVERAIRAQLELERPDDIILGEELGSSPSSLRSSLKDGKGSGLTWVIDPIDGTTSFMSGRPTFVLLIGVLHDGLPLLGLIDQPILRERWIGASGWDTSCNGQAVTTRECSQLSQAILSATTPSMFAVEDRFVCVTESVRATVYGGDGYAYGLLASGYQDLIIESGLKLHDFAALPPIITGAGGAITDWHGAPLTAKSDGRVIAAGDSRVHSQALRVLQGS